LLTVRIILYVSMAEFLLLLQIAAFYNGASMNLLPLAFSTSSSDPSKSPQCCAPVFLVPISVSGNNVYVAWSSNKTGGNFEVMFRASTDNGKTLGSKINLSNTPTADSLDAQIAAAGNNVYVSWWERANQTSNEPVLRVSNDNGKTFGEKIMLSAK
jgi:hypothetical protein